VVGGSAAIGLTAPASASVSQFETLPGGAIHVVTTPSGITHTGVINMPVGKAQNPAYPSDPCRNPNITAFRR
jgi:hypothetical protein